MYTLKKIYELPARVSPVTTDELLVQEELDGPYKKISLATLLLDVNTSITNLQNTKQESGKLVGINNQTVSDYTLALSDMGRAVMMDNAGPNNVNVPDNATVTFPILTVVHVYQKGAGQTTIVAAGGVTINATNTLKARTQKSWLTLIKVDTDEWVLHGDTQN